MYMASDNILTREECSLIPLFPNSNHGVQLGSKGVKFKESDSMVYGYIYKIENMLNGKVYIGQTVQNPKNRKLAHFNSLKNNTHKNPHLQSSFNKYGRTNFKFTVLNYATSKEVLDHLEQDYINHYNCLNPKNGYNLRYGGSYASFPPHICKKISESKRGKKHHYYGKHLSEEHRKKISESLKGRLVPIETRKKMSENSPRYWSGKKMSEKTRKKLSESHLGKKHTPDSCKKQRESKRGSSLFGFTCAKLNKNVIQENKPWMLRIRFNGYPKYIGMFEDPLTCGIIYDIVLKEIYGGK